MFTRVKFGAHIFELAVYPVEHYLYRKGSCCMHYIVHMIQARAERYLGWLNAVSITLFHHNCSIELKTSWRVSSLALLVLRGLWQKVSWIWLALYSAPV